MVDTTRIHSLIDRARRRLKLQSAMGMATLAAIPAFAAASAIWFCFRMEWFGLDTAILLSIGSGALVGVGAVWGLLRRFPGHLVAKRIDRASGLSDRLGTARAFEAALATGRSDDPDTHAMMEAAIRDAMAHAPRADVKAATPFAAPRDLGAAAAFAGVFLVLQLLWWALPNPTLQFPTTGVVTMDGKPLPDQEGSRGTLIFHRLQYGGASNGQQAQGSSDDTLRMPLGQSGAFTYDQILDAGAYSVSYQPDATLCDVDPRKRVTLMPCVTGPVIKHLRLGAQRHLEMATYKLDCDDDSCTLDIDLRRELIKDPVDFEKDDLDYIGELLEDLKQTANSDEDPSLQEFVKHVDELLAKAERGEISKEELLDQMRKAEERFQDGTDPNIDEAMSDLKKTGKELKKNKETKELGKALEKGDLEKAQDEMEKLAKKLENGKMSEKERKKLAKALEKAAEKFQKRDKKRDQDLDKKIAKKEKQQKKLKRQLKNEKSEHKRQKMSRQLKKNKRDLKKLQRKKQQRKKSQASRQLKQLHRNMKQAAQNMRSKSQKKQKKASRKMRDMQRNTGKVSKDRRKVRTQKKVASQMQDLKEAMRRAKRRGNKGPRDLFGKNRKKRDLARRARGLKGKKGAWKPGQKPGQGQGKPGGKGKKPGGSSYGDQHDPNLLGGETSKSGDTKDESVSGIHGKGPSQRETILSAAQKGFASRAYKDVYGKYKTIVEEIMQVEKVPSGYRNYIKKYFKSIKPHSMDSP